MESDDPVCYCFHVSKRKVWNFLRVHRPRVPSELSECGGAGTGCGWCIPYLKRYFQDFHAGRAPDESISREQYARERAAYIRAGKGIPAANAIPLPDEPPET